MITFAYLIPIIACIILRLPLDYNGPWLIYMWILVAGEATVWAMHRMMYRRHTSSREYIGSLVSKVCYEAPWTEIVVRTRTRTDSKGRTYTERYIEHVHHPESYSIITTCGSCLPVGPESFDSIRYLWQVPRHGDRWTGGDILGGVRYGCHYSFCDLEQAQAENPFYWVPITEYHRYTNKIRNSNSIFKFEKISAERASELGLLNYPEIEDYDAPCILSDDISVPEEVDTMFRKFNGRYAPQSQMRLFILLFDADKGPGISELQRAYWQGGNKNEFVVCIGIKPDGDIKWARAFSWADDQTLEVAAARWLTNQRRIDWQQFYDWLKENIGGWQRKQFADFDYINVTLPLSSFLIISAVSIVENIALIYLIAK